MALPPNIGAGKTSPNVIINNAQHTVTDDLHFHLQPGYDH